ncbi:hypothetical protein DFP72DRAFT_1150903 [Ephemerocybe angulata]|uniref:Uncharacterized protein n=1 Tax=Ephemerocybe angulata TaxID=980116 RepID=A0A8H6HJB6_9AGAR|nr:hypothetical protein DFP72DRAFT_1150903 [Tulosesus angulatus]
MKPFSWIFASLSIFAIGVQAAPVSIYDDLVARVPNLQLSLAEFKEYWPGDGKLKSWHFGLVAHAPGAIPPATADNRRFPLFHWFINTQNGQCRMLFGQDPVWTNMRTIKVTATLLAAGGEADDDAMKQAVSGIFQQVSSHISPNLFNNCLDNAVLGMRRLRMAGYIREEELEPFMVYWRRMHEVVHQVTDPWTFKDCGFITRRELVDSILEGRAPKCEGKGSKAATPAGKPNLKKPVVRAAKPQAGKGKAVKHPGQQGKQPGKQGPKGKQGRK